MGVVMLSGCILRSRFPFRLGVLSVETGTREREVGGPPVAHNSIDVSIIDLSETKVFKGMVNILENNSWVSCVSQCYLRWRNCEFESRGGRCPSPISSVRQWSYRLYTRAYQWWGDWLCTVCYHHRHNHWPYGLPAIQTEGDSGAGISRLGPMASLLCPVCLDIFARVRKKGGHVFHPAVATVFVIFSSFIYSSYVQYKILISQQVTSLSSVEIGFRSSMDVEYYISARNIFVRETQYYSHCITVWYYISRWTKD